MPNKYTFLSLIRPYRASFGAAFFLIAVTNILGLALPWAIKLIIDDVVMDGDYRLLNTIVLVLFAVISLKGAAGYAGKYMCLAGGERVVRDLRGRLYWHIQRLSLEHIHDTRTGTLLSRITGDVDRVRRFFFSGTLEFLYSCITMVLVLGVLFWLDRPLTLVSVALLPLFSFAVLRLGPNLKAHYARMREAYGHLSGRAGEVLSGIKTVRGLVQADYEDRLFREKQDDIVKEALRAYDLETRLWAGAEFLSALGLITLLWFGARAVLAGRITPGVLMAFYSYLGMLFQPVVRMSVIHNYYQDAASSLERINDILAKTREAGNKAKPLKPGRLKGGIVFEHVYFRYREGSESVLRDVSFTAEPGQAISLAGPSGAGKTTVVSLLARFYMPERGKILVDGYDLAQLDLDGYRAQLALVLQDDILFNDSIRKNIGYGCPDATDEDMIRAAKAAQAHEFISGLPEGYDAAVGDHGVKLSTGQKQRILIARAIIRDPALLILDEATSAVDFDTERKVVDDAYRTLMKDRTTFIISHRPAAAIYADKVLHIEDGTVREVEHKSHACVI